MLRYMHFFCLYTLSLKPDTIAATRTGHVHQKTVESRAPSNKEPCTLRPQRLRQPLVLRGARGGAALLDLQLDSGASPPGHRSLHAGRVGLHAGRVGLQGGASGIACRCERGCRVEQRLLTDRSARAASVARCSRRAVRAAAPPARSTTAESVTLGQAAGRRHSSGIHG